MGYEVTRFTHEIDEEFYCSICELILKDPMQSPSEHLFCYDCINQSCPVERRPLKLEDWKPAPRAFRNLINKFDIKCDFESKGCRELVKLGDLQHHVIRCEYNPNAKVRNEIVAQSDETSEFGSETSNESEVNERCEFRVLWENGKISIDQNVLEVDNGSGYVQSVNPLEPTKCSFKFEILSLGESIQIGLAPMCPSGGSPKLTALYHSDGFSIFNLESGNLRPVPGMFGPKWKVGETIECGINFPRDFVNDGRTVRVYFNRNGKIFAGWDVIMPIDGLFPTVHIEGGSKIKYLSN